MFRGLEGGGDICKAEQARWCLHCSAQEERGDRKKWTRELGEGRGKQAIRDRGIGSRVGNSGAEEDRRV